MFVGNTINYEGDIIFRRNIVFQDNECVDFKIKGHPTVNIYCDKKETKFLVMTSTKRDGVNYFTVKPDKKNKLKKETYVDLDHVYCEPSKSYFPSGRLTQQIYNSMLKDFIVSGDYIIPKQNHIKNRKDVSRNMEFAI